MSETTTHAQLRYLPEDSVFEAEVRDLSTAGVATADSTEEGRLASRWACVEMLADMPGVHAESGPDATVIWAEPEKLFAVSTPTETLTKFLSYLGYVLPTYPDDGVDYVVGLEVACDRGVSGVIMSAYDQYQRWLESGPVGDEILRRALAATVLPLRPEMSMVELDRTFHYKVESETERASIGSGSLRTGLTLIRGEFRDVNYYSQSGDPFGSCQRAEDVYLLRRAEIRRASGDAFGVLDVTRERFMPDGLRLYDMQSGLGCTPHPRELGGYLLAMGVLADEASRFTGGRPVADMAMRIEPFEVA